MVPSPLNRIAIPVAIALLAACKPPASDDYLERVDLSETGSFVSEPLASPDTEGAIWAPSDRDMRILYGKPGAVPLIALSCETDSASPQLRLTRFTPADPRAKAMMALVGNGTVARIAVDATWNGSAWLWQGDLAADDDGWEVLTGSRAVEATLPGAGTVVLNPGTAPGRLIEACRGDAAPE